MNSTLKGKSCQERNDLKAILASESLEFSMCKCSPFEETRFVTSSVAGNDLRVYNAFI